MSQVKSPITVAVSMSDSPDIQPLGLSEGHLKEAIAELALQLLAIDVNLAYGGDLRTYGFTKLLFKLVGSTANIVDRDLNLHGKRGLRFGSSRIFCILLQRF